MIFPVRSITSSPRITLGRRPHPDRTPEAWALPRPKCSCSLATARGRSRRLASSAKKNPRAVLRMQPCGGALGAARNNRSIIPPCGGRRGTRSRLSPPRCVQGAAAGGEGGDPGAVAVRDAVADAASMPLLPCEPPPAEWAAGRQPSSTSLREPMSCPGEVDRIAASAGRPCAVAAAFIYRHTPTHAVREWSPAVHRPAASCSCSPLHPGPARDASNPARGGGGGTVGCYRSASPDHSRASRDGAGDRGHGPTTSTWRRGPLRFPAMPRLIDAARGAV